jgi:pyrroline-5-carboxylate reductase
MSERPIVAILGAGAMGQALALGLLRAGWHADEITLAARRPERAADVERRVGARCLLDPSKALEGADLVVVAVKPVDVPALLGQISDTLTDQQVVLTLAAGVRTALLEQALGRVGVVRAMPNTPALVGEGITGIAPGSHADQNAVDLAASVLRAAGEVTVMDEALLDAVTAVSGTGPAYAFLLAEALTEAAVREGLPRDLAERLVNQTIKGAGALLVETELGPFELRSQVTSPGGTTAAAVHVLEERGFRAIVEDAVRAAAERARQLGSSAETED